MNRNEGLALQTKEQSEQAYEADKGNPKSEYMPKPLLATASNMIANTRI